MVMCKMWGQNLPHLGNRTVNQISVITDTIRASGVREHTIEHRRYTHSFLLHCGRDSPIQTGACSKVATMRSDANGDVQKPPLQ